MREPIVVSGLGIVSAIGVGKDAFWKGLCSGRSGIVATAIGPQASSAPIESLSLREFIRSPHLRRADELSRMIAAAARMALDDAVLDVRGHDPQRVAVVVGSALGNVRDSAPYLKKLLRQGPALASPMAFPNLVHNAAASYVAMEIGAMGANFTIADGEVSGEQAIALAADTLHAGRADVVVAGGGDDYVVDLVADTYHAFGDLARWRRKPVWCSPYDRDRNGVVLGKGAAMIVLETLTSAQRRQARVYATLRGCLRLSLDAPAAAWPADVAPAYAPLRALVSASDGQPVDLIVGSANSTIHLDACELALAERAVAGDQGLWMTSLKGAIGEFGAAGALAVVAACLALKEGLVPPLCNLRHPAIDASSTSTQRLRFAAERAHPANVRRALTLGIARGGSLAALLFDRVEEV